MFGGEVGGEGGEGSVERVLARARVGGRVQVGEEEEGRRMWREGGGWKRVFSEGESVSRRTRLKGKGVSDGTNRKEDESLNHFLYDDDRWLGSYREISRSWHRRMRGSFLKGQKTSKVSPTISNLEIEYFFFGGNEVRIEGV